MAKLMSLLKQSTSKITTFLQSQTSTHSSRRSHSASSRQSTKRARPTCRWTSSVVITDYSMIQIATSCLWIGNRTSNRSRVTWSRMRSWTIKSLWDRSTGYRYRSWERNWRHWRKTNSKSRWEISEEYDQRSLWKRRQIFPSLASEYCRNDNHFWAWYLYF